MASTLREVDGAKFYGRVEHLPDGQYRASCYARLDAGSHIDMETPEYFLCSSARDAKAWVDREAAKRGFTGIVWQPD